MKSEMPCTFFVASRRRSMISVRAGAPLVARFQGDIEAAGIDGRVHRARADEGRDARHIGILADDIGDGVLAFDHRLEGDGLRGIGDAE